MSPYTEAYEDMKEITTLTRWEVFEESLTAVKLEWKKG